MIMTRESDCLRRVVAIAIKPLARDWLLVTLSGFKRAFYKPEPANLTGTTTGNFVGFRVLKRDSETSCRNVKWLTKYFQREGEQGTELRIIRRAAPEKFLQPQLSGHGENDTFFDAV